MTGSIGGIRAGETRVRVERALGSGTVVSTRRSHQPVGGDVTLTRVWYPASQLTVVYVASAGQPQEVFGVFTTSARYRTADGLGVGSTFAQAKREAGVRCFYQPGYYACQGGLGYEKPIVSFTVKDGRVVRVFMAAVAD